MRLKSVFIYKKRNKLSGVLANLIFNETSAGQSLKAVPFKKNNFFSFERFFLAVDF